MEWMLYWVLKLDAIRGYLGGLTIPFYILIVLSFVGIIACVAYCDINSKDFDFLKRITKAPVIALISSVVLILLTDGVTTLIPTTKEAAIVFGVPMLIHSQKEALSTIEGMPKKVTKILDAKLDEWLDESTKKDSK